MVAPVRAAPALAGKPHGPPPPGLAMLEVAAAAAGEERLSDASTAAPNSSLSSASSAGSLPRCSSLSRLSFDCSPSAALAAARSPPPARVSRPHRSGDAAWAAIRAASTSAAAPLGPRDFKLLRRIGGGDIGTVYLCRLRNTARESPCQLYAMKVVDRRVVAKKKKLERAAAEKRILRALDHPFLPTLFADFDAAPHFSCVVMEFCPGGDLHSLRHRMPSRRFPLPSARFYAAEVLLALEYLHMMGIVYRDLKPENVLIRADGHIMLTDFDLTLESTSSPSLESADADDDGASTSVSCFPDHLFKRHRRQRRTAAPRTFVAEPVDARSCSFVGTHEYVAPEVARGGPHGAAVDWWALGVFLYELLHGRTPFAGADNESTLRNIAHRPLAFPPSSGPADAAARDLIAGLLAKDPARRLGSRRGAADVKAHPFFRGLNFALLRSSRPPVVPGASPLHRSQSCHAAPTTATPDKKKPPASAPDARFDLF
ncbi:hypothetical protein C2845_PM06G34060 [Panicum miliaceum]|uniref:non-specific serine/threonine protein kinase n=1 Tax=Panicum miliaceum TaxID=4540 RepID=A0A3L6RBQ8_PANMI|nr:hypothetical protein C2845_PM06G34060 [Panicum miliaceum]